MLSQLMGQIEFVEVLTKLVVLAVAIGAVIYERRRLKGVTDPSCGACGYSVRGLKVNRCPECGGDLKHVGVIQPDDVRPIGALIWFLIWSFFYWSIVMPIIGPFWPRVIESDVDKKFSDPASQRYEGIEIVYAEKRVWDTIASRTLTIELVHLDGAKSGLTTWEGDDSSFAISSDDQDLGVLQGTTPRDVLDWMRRHGIPVDNNTLRSGALNQPSIEAPADEAVRAEADAISTAIERISSGDLQFSDALDLALPDHRGSSGQSNAPLHEGAVYAFGPLIWIGGNLVIVLTRWKKRRAAMNPT